MNKKERRLALATALQSAADDMVVVDSVAAAAADGKTKSLVAALEAVGASPMEEKVLLVVGETDEMVMRAGRNIAKLAINTASAIKVFDVLNADVVVMEKAAVEQVNQMYGAQLEQQ